MNRVVLSLGILSLVLFSCSHPEATLEPSPPVSPTSQIETLEALELALSKAAVDFEPQAEINPVDGLQGRRYLVNGESLVALQSPLDVTEGAAPTALSNDVPELSNATRYWQSGQLTVFYGGTDGGLILLLSGLLGDAQAPEEPAQNEPYPPAVLAAIGRVSDQYDLAPTEIEVVSYDSVSWPDSCLGLPADEEGCKGSSISGWRIQLKSDGQSWQVHTDEYGERVRLQ